MKLGMTGRIGFAMVISLLVATASPGQEICGHWNLVTPPNGARSAILDVSVLSADDAWALAHGQGLARWNGNSWYLSSTPDLSEWTTIILRALTTHPSSYVFLVGNGQTGPFSSDIFLARRYGPTWDTVISLTLQPDSFGAPRNGAPHAVAATAADDVWIVGIADGLGGGVNGSPVLTVHWDGSELTEVLTPGVGGRQNNLYGAVAIASGDVWAVGEYNNTVPNALFHGLTYHWDGVSWTPIPNPTYDIDSTHLYAVDAVASNDVWAAGDSPDGPLFMHWDGNAWAIVPGPAATGTIQQLAAIASDDVWAVDSPWSYPGASKYYHWDGTNWSVVPPPDIIGAQMVSRHGGLAAVGVCDVWAVGSVNYGGDIDPFIERLEADGGVTAVSTPMTQPTAITRTTPNPFNPRVEIAFQLDRSATASLTIHDVRGRLVRTLQEGPLAAGEHVVSWDGSDGRGAALPSGNYFVTLYSTGKRETRSIVLLR